jgi:hypothetical protein
LLDATFSDGLGKIGCGTARLLNKSIHAGRHRLAA